MCGQEEGNVCGVCVCVCVLTSVRMSKRSTSCGAKNVSIFVLAWMLHSQAGVILGDLLMGLCLLLWCGWGGVCKPRCLYSWFIWVSVSARRASLCRMYMRLAGKTSSHWKSWGAYMLVMNGLLLLTFAVWRHSLYAFHWWIQAVRFFCGCGGVLVLVVVVCLRVGRSFRQAVMWAARVKCVVHSVHELNARNVVVRLFAKCDCALAVIFRSTATRCTSGTSVLTRVGVGWPAVRYRGVPSMDQNVGQPLTCGLKYWL